MRNSDRDLDVKEKVVDAGSVSPLRDVEVAGVAGGGFGVDARPCTIGGVTYDSCSCYYHNREQKAAVAAALNVLRPGVGDQLPEGDLFGGDLVIKDRINGKYRVYRIITNERGVTSGDE